MCPISHRYLYVAMLIAVVLFSFYLGSKEQPNPYENRNLMQDAKKGNFWARICLIYSLFFFVFMVVFFSCFI
jgi:hypothetical protein